MNNHTKRCAICEFYFIQDGGRCRRFPPQAILRIEDDHCPGDQSIEDEDFRFPYVGLIAETGWCGEFKKRVENDF